VLPDLPYYQEGTLDRIESRDIQGLHASCYHRYSRILDSSSDECYWRGIKVSMAGKNPIDGSDLRAVATSVEQGVPIDDALFSVPTDYAEEVSSLEDVTHGLYTSLLERMKSPRFTIAHLDRYASVP
jgi:hypothetical protein